MFITNELTPAEVLAEMLKLRRTSAEATKEFESLRHDKNLVPTFAAQVDAILSVYKAYRIDSHDIQGIRDDGVDVLLQFEHDDSAHRIAIQIKSNDEFDQWANKKLNVVEKLKAQYSAAMENARVNDYYIILCADDHIHRKRIRTICSEFKNYRHCTIIEPRHALGFFNMSPLDIAVRTTRLLCSADVVLRAALREMNAEKANMAYFLISLACCAFEHGPHVSNKRIVQFWTEWSELMQDAEELDDESAEIVESLLSMGVLELEGDDYAIDFTRLPAPLCALYFDLRVRSIEARADLRDYIVGLAELRDRGFEELSD
jgi:hypothetical protein